MDRYGIPEQPALDREICGIADEKYVRYLVA